MIKGIYSILDVKTSFIDPYIDVSDEAAIRGFNYMIKNQPGIIGFAPKDFSLYKIGEFDTKTGIITPFNVPRVIAEAYSSEVSINEA